MSEEFEEPPIYVCESFGVTNPEEGPRMQDWLNTQAINGYRLFDRQVTGSGGASKRIHVVMELQEYEEPAAVVEAEAEQGGE